jgi:hypothetical protein
MLKTEDNYNLYFDGVISQNNREIFAKLIIKHQLDTELINLVERQHNFRIYSSYNSHGIVLWILYKVLGEYAITIFFAELDHPFGCEYQSRVDFYVAGNGNFDYELKNSLFIYAEFDLSDKCKERIEQESIGFGKDCTVRDNMRRMDLEAFEKSIGSKD